MRTRAWFCRKHDHTEKLTSSLVKLLTDEIIVYFAIGEHSANTKSKHHHYIIYFKNKKSKKQIINLMKDGSHVPMRGTITECINYLNKDGKFNEWGIRPIQGKRNDIETARKIVQKTGKIYDVIMSTNSLQAIKYAEKVAKYLEPERNSDIAPIVLWLWGPTGTGKSRVSRKLGEYLASYNNEKPYTTGHSSKWFDGYDAHKVAIIEEFRSQEWDFVHLLRILDRHPYRVQIKGGYRQWVPNYIIVNTSQNPNYLAYGSEDIKQLGRRVTGTWHMSMTRSR